MVCTVQNTTSGVISWYGIRGFHQVLPGEKEILSEEEYQTDHIMTIPGLLLLSEQSDPQKEEHPMSNTEETKLDKEDKEIILEDLGEVVTLKHEPTIPNKRRGRRPKSATNTD